VVYGTRCSWCSTLYVPQRTNQRACSDECRSRLRCARQNELRRQHGRLPRVHKPANCEWCEAEFAPARATQRTCSKPCRVNLNNSEQNAKKRVTRIQVSCEACGHLFERSRSDSTYCSEHCRYVLIARRVRAVRIAARVPKYCVICQTAITAYRADAETCSSYCGGRYSKVQNRERYTARQQQRDAAKRNAIVGYGVPGLEWRRILRRSEGCCFYCGVKKPLTMEHVVPINRGGAHSIGNIVAACKSCNCSKNDSLLMEWRLRKGGGIKQCQVDRPMVG
jgi:predicted nucleic acid-binding Zn ribbon protein